jgi:hypothetical protein
MSDARRDLTGLVLPMVVALALAGCGDVEVATDVDFPKPLVDELPFTVGVYYSDEFRKYVHTEDRWGVEWKVQLGQFHVRMGDKLFDAAFRDTVSVKSPTEAPSDGQLRAIVEPRIEQYSFITPRDTGAKYYAVTIRYRLNVYAPDGRLADSLTFTGYGSSPSSGVTSTNPMILATKAAMRDAAAKFLVQFPEQGITKKMIADLPLIEAPTAVAGTPAPTGDEIPIESVPIVDAQPNVPPETPPAPPPDSPTPPSPEPGPAPTPPGGETSTPPTSPDVKVPEPPKENSPPQASPMERAVGQELPSRAVETDAYITWRWRTSVVATGFPSTKRGR